jgi:hypothetical protein
MDRTDLPPLGDDDAAYVRREFRTLAQVCAGRRDAPIDVRRFMMEGLLPRPSYLLPDGTQMVPGDYFDMVDAAGGPLALPGWFAERLGGELAARGLDASPARVGEEWDGTLRGEYGVCLRRVSPANIAEKARLIGAIEGALAAPRPRDPSWRRSLVAEVDRLDAMVRDFAAWDRLRFGGPVSRDRLIDAPRAAYPDLWPSGRLAGPGRGGAGDDAGAAVARAAPVARGPAKRRGG